MTVTITTHSPAQTQALAERLGDYDFVDAWQTRQAATAAAVERLSSMSMVVYILILFGPGPGPGQQ